jgi:glycerophosphoryl diester phosphodiesterase
MMQKKQVRPWIGHRGLGCTDHAFYQDLRDIQNLPVENTLDSFIAAYKAGASAFETDVCISKDGVPFVLHNTVPADHFFGEGNIPPQLLNHLTWDEIARYKTGRFQNGLVARLDEVLDVIAKHDDGRLPFAVNLELKHLSGSKQAYQKDDFIARVAEVVAQSPIPKERVLYSSFAAHLVLEMSHAQPAAQFAFLTREYREGDEHDPVKIGVYTNQTDDPLYQYLPFNQNTMDVLNKAWREQAHPQAQAQKRWVAMHPEIRTVNESMLDMMAQNKLAINAWGLFESPQDFTGLYRLMFEQTDHRNIPCHAINDYAEKMNRFVY